MPRWRTLGAPTFSTRGAKTATAATKLRGRRDMFLTTWWGTRIWMRTVTGDRIPATATSGSPMYPRGGPPIVRVIGPGSIPGDGLGWTTNRGVTLHFTMDDGCRWKAGGVGCRGRRKGEPFTRLL